MRQKLTSGTDQGQNNLDLDNADTTASNELKGIPVRVSPLENSNSFDLSNTSCPSFHQPSLMLSCETSGNGVPIKDDEPHNSSVGRSVTLSPMEMARSGNSFHSSGPQEAESRNIDFGESMGITSTFSADSLIATQSQHLSQLSTLSCQFECMSRKKQIEESVHSGPNFAFDENQSRNTDVTASELSQGTNREMQHNFGYLNEEGKANAAIFKSHYKVPNADTDIHFQESSTIDDNFMNDSELLLACNNLQIEEIAIGPKFSICENTKDEKSCEKTKEKTEGFRLHVEDICDSFDENDKLLIPTNAHSRDIIEMVDVVPESESHTILDSELPYSEGLESFLKSQLSSESNTVYPTAVKTFISNIHTVTVPPNSEDLFPDTNFHTNTESSSMSRLSCTVKSGSESLFGLPNTNDSRQGHIDVNRVKVSMVQIEDELASLNLHSTEVESFPVPNKKEYSANTKRVVSQGYDVQKVVSVSKESTKGTETNSPNTKNNTSNDNIEELEAFAYSCSDDFSNDLFASDCELSANPTGATNGMCNTGIIPESQDDSMQKQLNDTDLICGKTRRKSVHFASKLQKCAQISGIDEQMRTTPLATFRATKRKSCLINMNFVPDLPFSPVISDTNSKSLGGQIEDDIITPSPEIVSSVLRQISNTSYQSTPISLTSRRGNILKENKLVSYSEKGLKATKSLNRDVGKKNQSQDYSQELFSGNSCELFSTSHVSQQDNVDNSLSGFVQNAVSKNCSISERDGPQNISDRLGESELFSAGSGDLFSSQSFCVFAETPRNLRKKLFSH